MTRVKVVVEGQTEESFVKDLLAEVLWPYRVDLTPILLGVPGHKGGRPSYARVKKVLVQREMESWRPPLASITAIPAGQFAGPKAVVASRRAGD